MGAEVLPWPRVSVLPGRRAGRAAGARRPEPRRTSRGAAPTTQSARCRSRNPTSRPRPHGTRRSFRRARPRSSRPGPGRAHRVARPRRPRARRHATASSPSPGVRGLPPDDADLPGAGGRSRDRVARHRREKRDASCTVARRATQSIPAGRIANRRTSSSSLRRQRSRASCRALATLEQRLSARSRAACRRRARGRRRRCARSRSARASSPPPHPSP